MPARLLSVLALAAAAFAVYLADARRTVGMVGAFALLASPALVAYGSYGLPDATCMALSAAAFALSFRVMTREAGERLPHGLLLASVAAGLAVSAKYTAVPAFAPIGVAWIGWLAGRPGARLGRAVRSAAGLAVAGLGAFALGSPGWLLAPGRFIDGLRFEMAHAAEGHLGATGVPLLGQLELLAVGAPLLTIGGLAGLAFASRAADDERPGLALPAAALIGATLAIAALSSKQSLHYMVPALPALAWGLGRLAIVARRRAGWAGLTVVALCIAIAAGESLTRGMRHLGEPTDLTAGRWIEAHVDAERTVALDMGYVPALYDRERVAFLRGTKIGTVAPATVDRIERTRTVFAEVESIEHDVAWLDATTVDYLVTSEGCSERFFEFGRFTRRRPDAASELAGAFDRRRAFYSALFATPRWRIVHEVPAGNGPRVTVFERAARRQEPILD